MPRAIWAGSCVIIIKRPHETAVRWVFLTKREDRERRGLPLPVMGEA
jgi:hypothetical protein